MEVNGKTAELGCYVDPLKDRVRLDAMPVSLREEKLVVALDKPSGCVTTASDPQGRETVMDFIPDPG